MSTNLPSALGLGLAHTLTTIARKQGASEAACEALARAARALVAASESGHVCIRLSDLPGNTLQVRQQLLQTGLVGVAGASLTSTSASASAAEAAARASAMPLMLVRNDSSDYEQLYLYRFFDLERRLAQAVRRLCSDVPESTQPSQLASLAVTLQTLFHSGERSHHPANHEPDWQKVATALSLLRRLTIISGGPGTGKTTTVVAILTALLTQNPDLRIVLAAPTGKAAARMLDALRRRAAAFAEDEAIIAMFGNDLPQRLPDASFTVHRLLGVIPDSGRFRHDANHPLALDVLVVDEASMLDLALATRLLEALPAHARLILLGDKDQLAAVEAGAVFSTLSANPALSADTAARIAALCDVDIGRLPGTENGRPGVLRDSTVWLRRNFRFAANSPIGLLAGAIRGAAGDPSIKTADDATDDATDNAAIVSGVFSDLGSEVAPTTDSAGDSADNSSGNSSIRATAVFAALRLDPGTATLVQCPAGPLAASVLDTIAAAYAPFIAALRSQRAQPRAILDTFEQHRVLCALRQGPRGVTHLNLELTRRIRQSLEIPPDASQPWFTGRAVIITRNEYGLRLYNGDIGIALPDTGGRLLVWFPQQDGGMRPIAPARLPDHESAFATTVHKAQGSEFRHVSFILPSRDNPVLSREMVYTAITRASERVSLYGEPALLAKAIASTSHRESGLANLLKPD